MVNNFGCQALAQVFQLRSGIEFPHGLWDVITYISGLVTLAQLAPPGLFPGAACLHRAHHALQIIRAVQP